MRPAKRVRRTATTVLSGDCDPRPSRDVLTSLLNGVPPYHAVEKEDERLVREEKKERTRERKKAKKEEKARKAAAKEANAPTGASAPNPRFTAPFTFAMPQPITAAGQTPLYRVRPAIHIATGQRSLSVTPPPMTPPPMLQSSPGSTPGPDDSSTTSRTSSKRPYTPDTDYDGRSASSMAPKARAERRKRAAAKKGWKGWVEGSPEPSEKLINLDTAVIFRERRTRSGRNFDA